MKADFSRVTFKPEKHYRSVLMQQGRVTVDADPNEQAEIVNHRADETTADTVGSSGRPKGEFNVTISGGNLNISRGTLYLDGVPCVNNADNCTLTNQPFLPLDSTIVSAFPDLTAGTGNYAVYLLGFERQVTAVEDPEIRETALGGADTSVRSQWVWQVRMRRFDPGATVTCASVGNAWKPPFQPGLLTARAVPAQATTEQCVLPPTAEYRRLENQLYRVEIHRGGNRNQATFKWSRENGSVITGLRNSTPALTQTVGPTLQVETTGRDTDTGFGPDQWVELIDDAIELRRPTSPPALSRIQEVRSAVREIQLTTAASQPVRFDRHPKLRRWDHQGASANGLSMNGGADIHLEDGVVVSFSEGDYKPGDYWWIPARTAINDETGRIEWPRHNGLPAAQPSRLRERMCLLTVVNWNGSVLSPVTGFGQCVPEFPPLTAIQASDVGYTPGCPTLQNTKTVQQAIDTLCAREEGCCTIVVRPSPNWTDVFATIPSTGAHLCFRPGSYTVNRKVEVIGKGTIVISGVGDAAKVTALNDECALRFVNCNSVTIRDFSAQGQAAQLGSGAEDGILGVISIKNAIDVLVENCRFTSADGPHRTTACLSVHTANHATIRDNRFAAGVQQVGVLLSNVNNVLVEGNLVTGKTRNIGSISSLLSDPQFLAAIRTRLITNLFINVLDSQVPPSLGINVLHTVGGLTVRFRAPATHVNQWHTLLDQNPLPGTPSIANVEDHVLGLANRILKDNPFPSFSGLRATIFGNVTPAAQGITVGGTVGEFISIRDNRISGFIQCIHVGLSAPNPNISVAERVLILNNHISVTLGAGSTRGRHGIYVGNVSSVQIRGNRLTLLRPAGAQDMQIDGIRVFGRLGRHAVIRENYLTGYNVGIHFELRGALPATPMWLINDNIAEGSNPVVTAPNAASKVNNWG